MATKKFNSTEEYLNQISRLNRTIDNKLIELAQFKELAYGISSASADEKVQSSGNNDKMLNLCVKIEEMENEIDRIIDEYVDTKNYIIRQIESIDKEVYYEILFLRYIKQNKYKKKYSFEEIAIEISTSYRNTTRLHKQALQEFENRFGYLYLRDKNESCPIMS